MKKQRFPAALLGAAALAGCSRQASLPTQPPAAPPAAVNRPAPPVTAPPTAPRTKAVIYTVDEAHGTNADNYLVPHAVALTHPQAPAGDAIRALLAAPHTPIPAGTKLDGIRTEDGLVTVDFSRSPVDEAHGEEQQAQALEALQRTLGQFPAISRIQITVQGQALPSIGEAGGGPMDVIRPAERPQETGGA